MAKEVIAANIPKDKTVDIAAALLSALEREGIRPTTVSEMLRGD